MPETSAPAAASVGARFAVRHLQLVRAVFAALAAVMITFTADHSATIGLSVFSGFAIATGLVLAAAAWLTYPAGRRWAAILLAVVSLVAGMVSGLGGLRTITTYFVVVIAWAVLSGVIELVAGLRERATLRREGLLDPQRRSEARDAVTVGAVGILLAVALALVSPGFQLDYFIDDANQWFTLTGIAIAVGIFGAYAAIVAVFLGIAAFSPRRAAPAVEADTSTVTPTVGGDAE